jgi:chromosome segregation ATPase
LVLVLGGDFPGEEGIEVRPLRGAEMPLRDRSVDLVVCIEAFADLHPDAMRSILTEGRRVLRPAGAFAAWVRQPGTRLFSNVDADGGLGFYALEDALSGAFESVRIFAQMPWQGFAITVVPNDDEELGQPSLILDEALLADAPDASHYLALASRAETPLEDECTLVPVPGEAVFVPVEASPPEELLDELERLREDVSLRAAKSAAAHARIRELERELRAARSAEPDEDEQEAEGRLAEARDALERARATERTLSERLDRLAEARDALGTELDDARESNRRLEQTIAQLAEPDPDGGETDVEVLTASLGERDRALERAQSQHDRLREELEQGRERERAARERVEALEVERSELRRQIDVMVAEGEGARKLAARVEAELEVLRKRFTDQQDQLATKREESSRLSGEVGMLRARLTEQERRLDESRAHAAELTATAAEGAERGRTLTEVARDRDRLREELSTRNQQIEALEERLWEAREGLQHEKLQAVRLGADVERLRDQAERSREVERRTAAEVETLSGELRQLELQRVELNGLVRQRDESIERMVEEAQLQGGSQGTLRAEIERLRTEVARVQSQAEEAVAREQQLRETVTKQAGEVERAEELMRAAERAAEHDAAHLGRVESALSENARNLEETREAMKAGERAVEAAQARVRELERLRETAEEQTRAAVSADAERLAAVERLEAELLNVTTDRDRLRGALDSAGGADRALKEELDRTRALLLEREAEIARQSAPVLTPTSEHRLRLEIEVRRAEQEVMLSRLDAAEQRIWEMTDAADRNAARFEASLAQLEKQKDRVDQLLEELEVTRALLSAEQARTLEQERLLASERAKLARAGLGLEGFPRAREDDTTVEGVFAELNPNRAMVSLNTGPTSVPVPAPPRVGAPSAVHDRGASNNHLQTPPRPKPPLAVLPNRARIVVEEAEDDEWDEDG